MRTPVILELAPQLLDIDAQLQQRVEDELELRRCLSLAVIAARQRHGQQRGAAAALADLGGDVLRTDHAAGRQHDHRLDQVLDLAHVAGPVVVDEELHETTLFLPLPKPCRHSSHAESRPGALESIDWVEFSTILVRPSPYVSASVGRCWLHN